MEPLLFVMAILGCGESDAPCREVRLAQARYRSEAECVAATDDELMRHGDLAYPTVVAQCRPAGAAPQVLRGSEVMMPEGGELAVPPPRFAGTQERPRGPRR
jgi:hypothetical protein